jgi:penicillin-binding protein 1B
VLRRKRKDPAEGPPRKRRRRLGLVAKLGLALAAVLALLLLYLYVEVTTRFEGRLWDLPSHVYSARLALSPGDALTPAELTARLDRSGYARREGRAPLRAGQYRRRGSDLEVHRRAWEAPSRPIPDLDLVLAFRDGHVQSIRDRRGRRLAQVVFEPELLASLYGAQQEEREIVTLEAVPEALQQAVLAAEDERFYHHWGVDPVAVLRATFANVKSGHIVQGGSTIPQQTVKNLYHLGTERTWWRKVREVPMALMLDLRYSKKKIFEAYLNEVYLGQRGPVAVCGVAAAARFYFGRDLKDLTLAESALLAGLIRNPGGYNPFKHPKEALARRDRVLSAMEDEEMLDAEAARRAKAEPLHLASGSGGVARPSYVAAFVRAQLAETYSVDVLSREGLRIYTTVDTLLQDRAERALRDGLARLDRDMPSIRRQAGEKTLQGSLLALDPKTGAILALVGGRDFRDTQFNRAVQARRQPGSCFKPFVFLAAFAAAAQGKDGAVTPATLLKDQPIELRSGGRLWSPENYDRTFRGEVTARQALEDSINVPTIEAARAVGLEQVVATARDCGLPEMQPLPSIALGAQETTPLELATAFATLSQNGRRPSPRILSEVLEADGTVVEHVSRPPSQVVPPAPAFLVTDVLRGVLLRGTAAGAWSYGFRGNAAGKTGTTDDTRDAWFVGYTPTFLALVWVGYDDNGRTGLTGATGALPIWVDFMKRAGFPGGDLSFPEPTGIVHRTIDPMSGGLAVAACPTLSDEVFLEGTEPEEECPLHGGTGLWRWFKDLFE